MDDTELLRYSRHILLDAWGVEAQQRVRASHALLIGAGGLGSPAALYLAASGVGQLSLVDADEVDLTNLQRQIALRQADLSHNKAQATARTLAALNPLVQLHVHPQRATAQNLPDLLQGVDIVLDCTDNFATRHLINRACVARQIPLVSGAAIRFDAQITVFDARQAHSPCYACLYPEQAQEEEERCAVMGVFSPLVGIVGATQAAEALKLLAGVGTALVGRVLLLEALSMQWHALRLKRDPHCPVCAPQAA